MFGAVLAELQKTPIKPLALKTVDSILNGTVSSTPQSQLCTDQPLRPAPKIFKDTCRIDISKSLDEIYNFVRGLAPAPGAWAMLQTAAGEQVIKIYGARKIYTDHTLATGSIVSDGKKNIDIALQGGYLRITELQIAGKKRMPAAAFLCGAKFAEGDTIA